MHECISMAETKLYLEFQQKKKKEYEERPCSPCNTGWTMGRICFTQSFQHNLTLLIGVFLKALSALALYVTLFFCVLSSYIAWSFWRSFSAWIKWGQNNRSIIFNMMAGKASLNRYHLNGSLEVCVCVCVHVLMHIQMWGGF